MTIRSPTALGVSAGTILHNQRRDEVERLCRWLCELAIICSIAMVASEVFLRNLLGVSLQSADELGGYLLVSVSFLSLSTCFVSGAFHKVEFIDGRLSERGHAVRKLIFDIMSLAFCLILLWQLVRLVLRGNPVISPRLFSEPHYGFPNSSCPWESRPFAIR